MTEDRGKLFLDGFAFMSGTDTATPFKFKQLTRQPPPTDPYIKQLLGRALTEPAKLSPEEVRKMAASIVYHLLAEKEAERGEADEPNPTAV